MYFSHLRYRLSARNFYDLKIVSCDYSNSKCTIILCLITFFSSSNVALYEERKIHSDEVWTAKLDRDICLPTNAQSFEVIFLITHREDQLWNPPLPLCTVRGKKEFSYKKLFSKKYVCFISKVAKFNLSSIISWLLSTGTILRINLYKCFSLKVRIYSGSLKIPCLPHYKYPW